MKLIRVSALAISAGLTVGAAQSDEITVGFAVSKTGWLDAYSGPATAAAKMKIAEINASGGLLGRQIKIVEADAKTNPVESAKAGSEVIDAGSNMVVVDCDFDNGASAALAAQSAGLVSFFLCAGDPKAGIQGIGPYSFSGGNAAHVDGAAIAGYAYKEKGARKAYILSDNTIAYSASCDRGFEWAWNQLEGTEIIGRDVFQNGDSSIATQIDRIKALKDKPDLITFCTYIPGGASALRQIRSSGIDTLLMSGIGMDGTYWLSAVPNLNNFCVAAFGAIYGDKVEPELADWIKRYTAVAGQPPETAYALTGYAVIELWSKAVERAGTVESAAVVAELEKMVGEPTIMGPRGFTNQLHIADQSRYAIHCADNGVAQFRGYWTAGPVPQEILFAK